jgi:predicted nucleotidyltransferase
MATSRDIQEEVEQVIQRIVDKLRVGYAPQKVILFGSYASGTSRSGSDLDLLIIKDTPECFLDRSVTVRRVLSDPQRLLPLEVLVLTPQEVAERLAVGDQFVAEILEKGRVLYAA